MVGFFLLAPAMVWTLSHTAGRVLAGVFRVPYAVVRQQISGGMWRSAGTCAALMVGLAVLIVITVLVFVFRKKDPAPSWALWSIGGLTLLNVILAVAWR